MLSDAFPPAYSCDRMAQAPIERPLGPTEDMYWRFDAYSPLNFGVIARLRGPLELETLRRAMAALQGRHPLLRVHVACDDKGVPWFREGARAIPLEVVEAGPEATWQRLEETLNTSIDTVHGPMLRFLLLRHAPDDATLMLVFHHSISDGRSATFLLRDLLQSLAQQARGDSADLVPLPPAGYYGDRIPPVDSGRGMRRLEMAWKTLKASVFFLRGLGVPVGLHTEPESEPRPHRILLEPRFLEGESLRRTVERAKRERTTMQCVLNAALSLAVAEDSPPGPMQRIGCSQVIDIRARLKPPVGEDCGLFASGTSSLHHVDASTRFWPFARDIREHMDQSLATPLPFFHQASHSVLTNVAQGIGLSDRKKFSEAMHQLHPEGLAVSNLGRVDIAIEASPVRVTELAFGTNTSTLNDLSTSAVTYAGRLTWVFNGSDVLTRERLSRLADRAMEKIAEAVADGT